MAETSQSDAQLTYPRSISAASIDDKGRLKLPAEFTEYLRAIGVGKVFITTMDLQLARVYPISVWEENEKRAEEEIDDPEGVERLMFRAKNFGGNDDIDGSGRILIPMELRKQLGLEKQQVRVEVARNGVVSVMSNKVYEERYHASMAVGADDWKVARKKGWK